MARTKYVFIPVEPEDRPWPPPGETPGEKFFFACLHVGVGLGVVLVFVVLPILALVSG